MDRTIKSAAICGYVKRFITNVSPVPSEEVEHIQTHGSLSVLDSLRGWEPYTDVVRHTDEHDEERYYLVEWE